MEQWLALSLRNFGLGLESRIYRKQERWLMRASVRY